ncbi:MAG: hypothetical protein EAX90_11200 [Candidatus Heimdallarchaeota archaeon]|nr:hypothetical protein [Candidatus Heimdallarchaeota archaeon]
MIENCKKEVIGLHEFFKQWFNAEIENTDTNFSRLTEVIDDDFMLIMPNGFSTTKKDLLVQLRAGFGSHKNDKITYRLWVKNIVCRLIEGNLCLVTYEEWGEIEGRVNARLSSALFRKKDEAPNGVEWFHVHETLFPVKN